MTPAELRAALSAIGWTGRELARALGCGPGTTSDWALGRRKVPDAVAMWLHALKDAHARHPAPDWRSRSAA